MFLDSLLESSPHPQRRRSWPTVVSFALEVMVVAVMVMAPLMFTGALPPLHWGFTTVSVPPAAPPHGPSRPVGNSRPTTEGADSGFHEPRVIPISIATGPDPVRPPVFGDDSGGVEGSPGPISGTTDWTLWEVLSVKPAAVSGPVTRAVVSTGVMEGLLIRRVEPLYPSLAITTRTEGVVLLTALISKDGRVEELQVVSGHPFLAKAALDAVRQWRYRPYLLNDRPVEVQAQITIHFRLQR